MIRLPKNGYEWGGAIHGTVMVLGILVIVILILTAPDPYHPPYSGYLEENSE